FGNSGIFSVICNTSFDPPKPFIDANGKKVEILTITDTEVRVRNSFSTTYCSNDSGIPVATSDYQYGAPYVGLDLSNTPFSVSYTKNSLYGIGCDVSQVLLWSTEDHDEFIIPEFQINSPYLKKECETSCDNVKEHTRKMSCNSTGYICCETTIPKGLKIFIGEVEATTLDELGGTDFAPVFPNTCTVALLAEVGQYSFDPLDLKVGGFNNTYRNIVIPVVLDWAVGSNTTCVEAKQNHKTYACQENSDCSDTIKTPGDQPIVVNNLGYRCSCKKGFEGNPYLEPGCK
ncbi:hypothetical protein MKW94_012682, partial [Papaver nudicaule]|nr:hypothetical protein [Papaver nudicaule]